jgi:hypothetical protein
VHLSTAGMTKTIAGETCTLGQKCSNTTVLSGTAINPPHSLLEKCHQPHLTGSRS